MHAWDCACGTRNAPSFTACRACGGPTAAGSPVRLAHQKQSGAPRWRWVVAAFVLLALTIAAARAVRRPAVAQEPGPAAISRLLPCGHPSTSYTAGGGSSSWHCSYGHHYIEGRRGLLFPY